MPLKDTEPMTPEEVAALTPHDYLSTAAFTFCKYVDEESINNPAPAWLGMGSMELGIVIAPLGVDDWSDAETLRQAPIADSDTVHYAVRVEFADKNIKGPGWVTLSVSRDGYWPAVRSMTEGTWHPIPPDSLNDRHIETMKAMGSWLIKGEIPVKATFP